ncbi:homocitrate synthase/isopropylmalate synthase family protein [Spirochaeta cellobiosiphila]|uniref:homocitrate synthase/isopropylmalate synthase family protein n=1 Tax=Spirochaeta cellobiosiphila TaxID=504483 RepID=UPI00042738E6|nr:hypothetical protein [Spirochaeta cellobiosiphila]
MNKYEQLWIIDSTLRDGLQAPGVSLNHSEKKAIARMLAEAGVNELEAGIPIMDKQEIRFLRSLKHDIPNVRVTAWCRARKEDILEAARSNVSSIHIAFPVSDIQLKLYEKDWKWVLDTIPELVALARVHFDYVSLGAMDATRASLHDLKQFVHRADAAGVNRVRIADTVGISTPDQIKELFEKLHVNTKAILEFHGHNDLGLATANSLAAVEGGAKEISVTISGVGERAGNASLEEVVTALPYQGNYFTSVSRKALPTLASTFKELSGFDRNMCNPITGVNVFTHESGVHGHGLLQDDRTFCELDPKEFGYDGHSFVVGSHSGSFMVQRILSDQGVFITREEALAMLPQIRETSEVKHSYLENKEILDIYKHFKDTLSHAVTA